MSRPKCKSERVNLMLRVPKPLRECIREVAAADSKRTGKYCSMNDLAVKVLMIYFNHGRRDPQP